MTSNPTNKKIIIVAGPTAVGKTALAVTVASALGTEIISADSRQCYRELDIGVARPSPAELAAVPHHFIASHSIHEGITAADFENYALAKTQELFRRYDTVVMVGGTGLYIRAFADGLDPVPPADPAIRQAITQGYFQDGLPWLQSEIARLDPRFASVAEMQNPRRIMRALEVVQSTGQSILSFQTGAKARRNFSVIKTAVNLPREQLNERIRHRVLQMMESGQLQEAQALLPFKHLNALRTVGYSELFDHLEGRTTLEHAVELITQHTRQYAKRQVTWFKKDGDFAWFTPEQADSLIELARKKNL